MRVGVVGLGAMGRVHLDEWQRIGGDDVDLDLHVLDPHGTARDTSDVTGHDTLERLLAAVDVVDICTPTDTHAALVTTAARAGRHVICEKPVALTVEDAVAAARVCRDAGVQLHVGHVVRYVGEYAAAHAALTAGAIGAPAVLHYRRASTMPRHAGWLLDEHRSGGLVVDLMIHDLDQVRWIAGEVVRVHAQSARPSPTGQHLHAYAVLTHADGAISHVTASWGLNRGFETSFEIAGTEGMLVHDSTSTATLRADTDDVLDAPGLLPVMLGDTPFRLELEDFLGALRGDRDARVTVGDAVQAVATATAVRESIRSGAVVEVPALPSDLLPHEDLVRA